MPLASLKDEASSSQDVENGVTENSISEVSLPTQRQSGAAKLREIFHAQSEKFDEEEMPTPGKVTVVDSLDGYEGANIYEKLDNFTKTHQIALVNRSWCLFSIDAVDFFSRMGIAVHSFEVDNHSHEKYLVKHLKQKFKHETSPWIFIAGDFVGGYEDVNTMYSSGKLDEDITSKIHGTQADKCELVAAKSTTKPLFWFPVTVNAHAVRLTGVATSTTATASVVLSLLLPPIGQFLAYYLVVDFMLRILGGGNMSPMAWACGKLVSCWQPKPRSGRPKQFAACCGLLFSLLGSIFYIIPFPYHEVVGCVFMGGLALASGMEGYLDFCLGCVFFRIGLQLKLIPK